MSHLSDVGSASAVSPQICSTPEMVHRSVGISSADSIKVAVRVRPLNSKEVAAHVSESAAVAEVRYSTLCALF